MLAVIAASAQGDVDELRASLEKRFEIVPIANGVVLTPRFRTSIKSVELSDSTIAIDGAPVTGRELQRASRQRCRCGAAAFVSRPRRAAIARDRANASAEAGRPDSADSRSRFHGPHGAASAAHAARPPPRRHRSHRRQRDGRQRRIRARRRRRGRRKREHQRRSRWRGRGGRRIGALRTAGRRPWRHHRRGRRRFARFQRRHSRVD